MTALHVLYVASIAGAMLFFVAGAAAMSLRLGRRTRPADSEALRATLAASDAHVGHQAALDEAQEELARTRTAAHVEVDRATKDVERIAAELKQARAETTSLRAQLERANRNAPSHAAVAEIPSLNGSARQTTQERAARERADAAETQLRVLRARVETADGEVARLRAAAETTERELRDAKTRAERIAGELEAASAQIARLGGELEQARTDATGAASEVKQIDVRARDLERQLGERTQQVRDLATENEQLRGRVRDAEGLRTEYVRLRTSSVESEYLKTEIARLEEEVRALRADALAVARPPARTRTTRSTAQQNGATVAGVTGSTTISESLLGVLDRFADAGTRSLTVADSIGFPLAATGNDAHALAAYATLLAESALRATQFLPFARPVTIEIIDERGARVSVWPFDIDGDRLLLANLAVAPVEPVRVETTLAALSAILAPSAIAS